MEGIDLSIKEINAKRAARIDTLQKKRDELAAQIKFEKSAEAAEIRKRDIRRNIIIGGIVMNWITNKTFPISAEMERQLVKEIRELPEKDQKLFGKKNPQASKSP